MKQRCTNPKSKKYHIYGGKGITVDSVWDDFKEFKEWAMSNGYEDTLTIDRIDSSKGYTPSNCKWIPSEENSAKTSKVREVIQWRRVSTAEKVRFEKIFTSGAEAARELDLTANHINRSCVRNESLIITGDRPKYTHGGFMWTYLDSLSQEWQDEYRSR